MATGTSWRFHFSSLNDWPTSATLFLPQSLSSCSDTYFYCLKPAESVEHGLFVKHSVSPYTWVDSMLFKLSHSSTYSVLVINRLSFHMPLTFKFTCARCQSCHPHSLPITALFRELSVQRPLCYTFAFEFAIWTRPLLSFAFILHFYFHVKASNSRSSVTPWPPRKYTSTHQARIVGMAYSLTFSVHNLVRLPSRMSFS
jgi:hypothetical protein